MKSRRQFIKKALAATAGMGAYASLGLQFSAMKAMASQQRFSDHKALVCVFLYGGNDSFNMLIPSEAHQYAEYQRTRQSIALPLEGTHALNLSQSISPHVMPPSMGEVAQLFNQGQLSVASNVGVLKEPVTKAQLLADSNKLPPLLFSHNSQQALWQMAGTNTQSISGWLGRMSDLLQDTQTALPMNIGINSSDILSTGVSTQPLVVNASGPDDLRLLNPQSSADAQRINAHQQLASLARHPMTRTMGQRISQASANTEVLKAALSNTPVRTSMYPEGNGLAAQLNMVADMIAVQSALNQQRQVFFVGLGGWDTHDNQVEQHAGLLGTLSSALGAFQADLIQMGLNEQVTTVTLSEFGRTLTSNRDGTDHGWAGHQLVMGGAVNGGRIIGHLPEQRLNTNDDWDDGRMIPTTSIEQFGANLATWFGLSQNEINTIFPTLNRFDTDAVNFFV